MCGIVCIYNTNLDNKNNVEICRNMTEKLHRRGPDDISVLNVKNVCLGHTRLSIIDLEDGNQPIFNEDGSVCTILNGEIYNYKELRNLLIANGHILKTRSDTEVLVHLYEDYGEGLIDKLDGMFSFVIYDLKNNRLIVARDRMGEKPLVYYKDEKFFLFASEIKSLLEYPNINKKISYEALGLYLRSGYIPAPYTIYENIFKLKPSHFIKIENNHFDIIKYWNPDIKIDYTLNIDGIKNQLKFLLNNSIKNRSHADVPLGVFLSGGLDSSIITAFLAQQSDKRINTYTVGFSDAYDERSHAEKVSKKYNTIHHELFIESDIATTFQYVTDYFDEPFADSSNIPTYLVSNAAREHVKVILSGDGGDELFGGYSSYVWQKYSVYGKYFNAIFRRLNQRLIQNFNSDFSSFLKPSTKYNYLSAWTERRNFFNNDEIKLLLNTSSGTFLEEIYKENKWLPLNGSDSLTCAFEYDMNLYLPDDLLKKVDMSSMSCGLETRAPFLDHKIVEFAFTISPYLKMNNDISKYIIRDFSKNYLPDSIVKREKIGFGSPILHWLTNQLKSFLLDSLGKNCLSRDYLDYSTVEKLIDEIINPKGPYRPGTAGKLWSIFVFENWLRKYNS